MASKRRLKKEIKYFVNDLIAECEVYMKFHPEADQARIEQVILNLKDKEASLLKDINKHYPEKSASEQKKHFNSILNVSRDELIAELENLPTAAQ